MWTNTQASQAKKPEKFYETQVHNSSSAQSPPSDQSNDSMRYPDLLLNQCGDILSFLQLPGATPGSGFPF